MDLARVFMGEVTHLSAELQRRNPKVSGEDTVTTMLKHRNGGVSLVECTYEAKRVPDIFPETRIELEGSRGSILLKPSSALEMTVDGKLTKEDADAPVLHWAERPWHIIQESVLATCAHILDRFRAGKPADVSADDNVRTFGLCEAAYTAAREKRAIEIRGV
jgi:predicted dehydrogenase